MTQAAEVSFSPRQLPELRSNLVTVFPTWAEGVPSSPFAKQGKSIVPRLAEADLFYMTDDFDRLVRSASLSLPNHVLTEKAPPTRSGIVVRPKAEMRKLTLPDGSQDWCVTAAGFAWLISDDGLYIGELVCASLIDMASGRAPEGYPEMPKLMPAMAGVRFGADIVSVETGPNSFATSIIRSLLAFWNIVRQTSITETVYDPVRRPERRRLERAGIVPPKSVRIIYLRRRGGHSGSDETDRAYRHRWIVRGHWRQQWYPVLQDHRPVWIAPHMKGPEGAPLLGGEKVYVADAVTAGGAA